MAGRSSGAGYNFTQHVRSVLQKSRMEAAALSHEFVGTEHILLALVTEPDSIAVAALGSLGIDTQAVRATILDVVKKGRSEIIDPHELPYTSRAKKVLELAMTEARELGHTYVGTEHLLLGLVREEKGIAAQVLAERGVELESARREVLRLTGERGIASSRGKTDPVPPAEASGELARVVAWRWSPHSYGDAVLRVTLAVVSIIAGASTLVRLFTSDDVISWYATLVSTIELGGGALLLHPRTTRTGAGILLVVFAMVIVSRLAQGAFPGPVLVQAAATFFLLTWGVTSHRLTREQRS